ncbi:NAD(P)/FAD-dependent oxidoreductase [Halorubrum sp. CBA1229]|uniref:NAD(P)/FAD-dependent oxidoreductase n=1 Tax=Halorubrum sp. CBA1229 TaxID=1853699 RepID=UPI001592BA5E|nr:NAD(P)/FAD-dependent oxidoreductase [Halorubrum sp. CBA1229]QKY18561.1 NAD(P)/FAD-dependent oxidoreductase [Halorubrum sp. CBA1229]QKY18751.1 NAD(P)/FAD-dependent oxidoreductase [Halorubrum sp. CBA1229]
MNQTPTVAILGGAMAGLAAAEGFQRAGCDVELYERQTYNEKRVNCGEAMTAASAIPLEKTAENGFINPLPEMEVEVYDGVQPGRQCTGRGKFTAPDAYITDRNVVEQSWADRLTQRGVDVNENQSITPAELFEFADGYNVIVDATGQPSLTSKALQSTGEYSGYLVALNADVVGDFSDVYPNSQIILENYTGYTWAFTKTPNRANVGIGWAVSDRPDDYMAAFKRACERNGWPTPTQERTNVAIIPEGPSLDPQRTYHPDHSIVRVGDAAGIANRLTGKGISQAIQSSYLAAELAAEDRLEAYPEQLYREMKPEYLLATVIRYFTETRQPQILGKAIQAGSGMDIEAVDRSPRDVLIQLARHPRLFVQIFGKRKVLQRVYQAATDQWEYTSIPNGESPISDSSF